MPVDAVTFDFWNTLAYEDIGGLRDRRAEAWLGLLEGAGFALERQRLDAVFESAWQAYVERWHANEQFHATHAAEHALEQLGHEVPDDVRDALVDAFTNAGSQIELHLTEHLPETLEALRSAGVRLGIICDVGFTPSPALRDHLARHGVLDRFDHWSFSDEVGAYKPSPVIFTHALQGLGGVDPARTAHIGDLRRTDIAGARAMGMTAIRYVGVYDDDSTPEPEGHHVLHDLADLPATLGLA